MKPLSPVALYCLGIARVEFPDRRWAVVDLDERKIMVAGGPPEDALVAEVELAPPRFSSLITPKVETSGPDPAQVKRLRRVLARALVETASTQAQVLFYERTVPEPDTGEEP